MLSRLLIVLCAGWFLLVAMLQALTGNAKYDIEMLLIGAAPIIGVEILRRLTMYVLLGRWTFERKID